MGYAKLSTGEELAYLGVPGLRVAGGQGVAIIAFCQVRAPLSLAATGSSGRLECFPAWPGCLGWAHPCEAHCGKHSQCVTAARRRTLPLPPCPSLKRPLPPLSPRSRCCSCLGPSMPGPAALQRLSRLVSSCQETKTIQVRGPWAAGAAGRDKASPNAKRRCWPGEPHLHALAPLPARDGLRLEPCCRRLAVRSPEIVG